MIGLSTENDVSDRRSFTKNHKFANGLAGRFNVSGISGGFEKHRRLLNSMSVSAKEKKQLLSTYRDAPFLEIAHNLELRKDAEKLLEMEEKIKEV